MLSVQHLLLHNSFLHFCLIDKLLPTHRYLSSVRTLRLMFHLGPASEEKPAINNKHIFCHCEFTNQLEDSKKLCIFLIICYLLLQFCQLLLILMVILMLMASPELLLVVGHLLVMVEFAV